MSPVLAIDPGTEQSAYVVFDGERVLASGIEPNDDIACICADPSQFYKRGIRRLAVEMVVAGRISGPPSRWP